MPLDLYFPLLNGGVEQGLNDAGIETFEGEFQKHIVRECTQNALDARASSTGQVRIELRLRQIPATEIPGLAALRAAIQSSREYWRGNAKTDAFCAKALSWTAGNELTILEVSDYGTKGLNGAVVRSSSGKQNLRAAFVKSRRIAARASCRGSRARTAHEAKSDLFLARSLRLHRKTVLQGDLEILEPQLEREFSGGIEVLAFRAVPIGWHRG